ncbi:IS30 family transposase [Streptomyces bobili]
MPRYAPNRVPTAVKKRYFELLHEGYRGAAAARQVGVSTSCGSLWFIDAGSMIIPDPGPISPRFLTQDDRIAIADGLHSDQIVKRIAASIGKSFESVYREIERNSKPDGRYNPGGPTTRPACVAGVRKRRRSGSASRCRRSCARSSLRSGLLSRSRVTWPANTPTTHRLRACPETIYRALFAGFLGRRDAKLRTGRTRRKKQRRGVPTLNKIKNMTLIHQRPVEVNDRRAPGHWEGDLIIGRGQGSAIGTLVERTRPAAAVLSQGNRPVSPHRTRPSRRRPPTQPPTPHRPRGQDPGRDHAKMPHGPIDQVIRNH